MGYCRLLSATVGYCRLLSATVGHRACQTVGYCRPQGLPDESVPASAFTNHRGVGAGASVRLLDARWVWVPPALGVQPYGCAGYAGDLYSFCVALMQSSVVQCHNMPRPCALQVV